LDESLLRAKCLGSSQGDAAHPRESFDVFFLTSWIVQVEAYPPPLVETTIDFLAVGVETKEVAYNPMIPPTDRVAGRLVFARPMFADVPLVPFDERAHFLFFHARVTMLA